MTQRQFGARLFFPSIFVLASLLTSAVYAFDGNEVNSRSLRLTPFSSWVQQSAGSERLFWQRVSNAILHLQSDSGPCAATRISSEGHFLTARHCLQKCLIRSGVFKPVSEQGLVTYFERDPEQEGRASCAVSLDSMPLEITIEAVGPGVVLPMDEGSFRAVNSSKLQGLIEKGYTSSGDFVIFKTHSPELQRGPFLRWSKNAIKPGEMVTSIGFPTETNRPDGFNSDGETRYITRGVVSQGIESNQCLDGLEVNESTKERLQKSFNDPMSFLSTLDVVYGSSGSVVVNFRGEIVGILTNVFRLTAVTRKSEDEPENRYCSGSAKALRIERIRDLLSGSALLSRLEPN